MGFYAILLTNLATLFRYYSPILEFLSKSTQNSEINKISYSIELELTFMSHDGQLLLRRIVFLRIRIHRVCSTSKFQCLLSSSQDGMIEGLLLVEFFLRLKFIVKILVVHICLRPCFISNYINNQPKKL